MEHGIGKGLVKNGPLKLSFDWTFFGKGKAKIRSRYLKKVIFKSNRSPKAQGVSQT